MFFNGWLMSPKPVYSTYVWSTNVSQGLPAQVVVAGFVAYNFSPRALVGAGIPGLPGARSTEGQCAGWLGTDNRLIADEFFRPSYTSGLFARGQLAKGLDYAVMWGDNLSQLGIDAGQLGNDMKTFSGGWSGCRPPASTARRKAMAISRITRPRPLESASITRAATKIARNSPTRRRPTTRRSASRMGTSCSSRTSSGPASASTNVVDQMESLDAGVKYRGFALEGDSTTGGS